MKTKSSRRRKIRTKISPCIETTVLSKAPSHEKGRHLLGDASMLLLLLLFGMLTNCAYGFSTTTLSHNAFSTIKQSSRSPRTHLSTSWSHEQSTQPPSTDDTSNSLLNEGDQGAITNEKISLIYKFLSLLRVMVDNIRPRLTTTTTTTNRLGKGGRRKLVETAAFKSLSDWAFAVCDARGDGKIQREELYSGILLVHLHLAKYVGVAACQPLHRTQVDELFDMAASYHNAKTIGQREFEDIVIYSCAQITTRISVYYTMLLVLAPLLTQKIIKTARYFKHTLFESHTSFGALDPLWLFGEWLIEHTISVSVFVLVIPWTFSVLDPYMRRWIKPRQERNSRNIFWWQKLDLVQQQLRQATSVDDIKQVFHNATQLTHNDTKPENKVDHHDSKRPSHNMT